MARVLIICDEVTYGRWPALDSLENELKAHHTITRYACGTFLNRLASWQQLGDELASHDAVILTPCYNKESGLPEVGYLVGAVRTGERQRSDGRKIPIFVVADDERRISLQGLTDRNKPERCYLMMLTHDGRDQFAQEVEMIDAEIGVNGDVVLADDLAPQQDLIQQIFDLEVMRKLRRRLNLQLGNFNDAHQFLTKACLTGIPVGLVVVDTIENEGRRLTGVGMVRFVSSIPVLKDVPVLLYSSRTSGHNELLTLSRPVDSAHLLTEQNLKHVAGHLDAMLAHLT